MTKKKVERRGPKCPVKDFIEKFEIQKDVSFSNNV